MADSLKAVNLAACSQSLLPDQCSKKDEGEKGRRGNNIACDTHADIIGVIYILKITLHVTLMQISFG